eukprot:Tamp_06506.p1 GENE.Tamp_06506~~Tamp_06506.p1  ORF type:complete len:693 (-),score=91.17 Tamp_06506:100-2178(-)
MLREEDDYHAHDYLPLQRDDCSESVAFLRSQGLTAIAERFSEHTGKELKAQLRMLREEDSDLRPWHKRQLIELVRDSTAHTLSLTQSSLRGNDLSGADTASEGGEAAADNGGEEEAVTARHSGNPADFQEHMHGFLMDFLKPSSTQEPDGAEIYHLNHMNHAGTSHQWTYCMLLWMRFAKDATFGESSRGQWRDLVCIARARQPEFLAGLDAILRQTATEHDLWSVEDFQLLGCRKEYAAAIFVTNSLVLHHLQRRADSLAIWKREVENNWFETDESAPAFLLRANRFLRQHLIEEMIILNQIVETQSYVAFMRMTRLASLLLFEYLESRKLEHELPQVGTFRRRLGTLFHGFVLFVSSSNRVFSLTKADVPAFRAIPTVREGLRCLSRLSSPAWEMLGPVKTARQQLTLFQERELDIPSKSERREVHKSFFSLFFPCFAPPLPAGGHQEDKEDESATNTQKVAGGSDPAHMKLPSVSFTNTADKQGTEVMTHYHDPWSETHRGIQCSSSSSSYLEKDSQPPHEKLSASVHRTKTLDEGSHGPSIEAELVILHKDEWTKTKETMVEDGVVRQQPAQVTSTTPVDSTTPDESLPPSPRTAALERMEKLEREIKDFATDLNKSPVPLSANGVHQGQQQDTDKMEDREGDNLARLFDGFLGLRIATANDTLSARKGVAASAGTKQVMFGPVFESS